MSNTDTDLDIRIINKSGTSKEVLIYQKDDKLSVKNYFIGAWSVYRLANGSHQDLVLPFAIGVQAREKAEVGAGATKSRQAGWNTSWEMYDDSNGALSLREGGTAPDDNTINVWNKVMIARKTAVVTKNGMPLFASDIPPDEYVSFSVSPKFYVAMSQDYKTGELYKAVTLTPKTEIDFEGETAVVVTVTENAAGLVTVSHAFTQAIDDFNPNNAENTLSPLR